MQGNFTDLGQKQFPEPYYEHLFGFKVPIPRTSNIKYLASASTSICSEEDSTGSACSSPKFNGIGLLPDLPWSHSFPLFISSTSSPSCTTSSQNSTPTSYASVPSPPPNCPVHVDNKDASRPLFLPQVQVEIPDEPCANYPNDIKMIDGSEPQHVVTVESEERILGKEEWQEECEEEGYSKGACFFPRRARFPTAEPFTRKSKWGMAHSVTPMRATEGFVCTFPTSPGARVCTRKVALPHQMRKHLIETHAQFSPFQCENCKRVYARSCTRHKRMLRCPNKFVEPDEYYKPRRDVANAIRAIQTSQDEVDHAVKLVLKWNGKIEGRKKRNTNRRGGSGGEGINMTRYHRQRL